MKSHYLFLVCILTATTASFSVPDIPGEYDIDTLTLDAEKKNSKKNCQNGDWDEVKRVCKCKADWGYHPGDKDCIECKCGEGANCTFSSGFLTWGSFEKKCNCKKGFAVKSKICVGTCKPNPCENKGSCEVINNGKSIKCHCVAPYGGELCKEKTDCKCENGRCVSNKQGHTKCICKPGFALQDEFTCKPCDCGSLGKCTFILKQTSSESSDKSEYQKKCICDTGSAEKDGICVACSCGDNSTCEFDNGEKTCYCIEGYSEKDGRCTVCDCGSNSESCEFINGVKSCNCKDGYADRYGTCEECYCGAYSRNCNFIDNQKTCNCSDDYVQKGEECKLGCSAKNPCRKGGYCKEGLCFCQNGTRGEFCDEIEGCPDLCPKNRTDIECSYDVATRKAYCKCLDGELSYDPNKKQCRWPCVRHEECGRGTCGPSSTYCECLPGVRGDRCETADCPNGVFKCNRQVHLLWWGGDALFLFQGQKLLRFQRQGGDLQKAMEDCNFNDDHGFYCSWHHDNIEDGLHVMWNGADRLCVPWRQTLMLNFRRI